MARRGPKPKYQVCPQCEGSGTMVHRSLSVWTAEDRYEDPDGFEDMMNGAYDVSCDMCDGQRVVTREDLQAFQHRREDHYTMLMESGIGPGHRDWH